MHGLETLHIPPLRGRYFKPDPCSGFPISGQVCIGLEAVCIEGGQVSGGISALLRQYSFMTLDNT